MMLSVGRDPETQHVTLKPVLERREGKNTGMHNHTDNTLGCILHVQFGI